MAENPKPASRSDAASSDSHKFGTFKGVFTPSILTILGVIMYLRMGYVVGNVGIIGTLAIIAIATAITFLTSLSISATATNMTVGGGGAYFLLSRSLGVEAGAAIGIPLFLAQALGISFYISGFSESVLTFLPEASLWQISLVSLVVLTALAYLSADLALKAQFFVLAAIVFSLVCFFVGGMTEEKIIATSSNIQQRAGFWQVFAVFFPAVTGIEAGLAMSGELKSPSKSLPNGTIAAVAVGLVVYTSIAITLYTVADQPSLLGDPLIMAKVSVYGMAIFIGIWGATLSSALGALLGAPRTLQALAKDRVVPMFLGRTFGAADSPRIATVFTFMVALVGILLGDLNAIAPVISMFFLTSYGMLNVTCLFEDLISNPSWRPRFKIKWYYSLSGAIGCFAAMFMINPGATFIAIILIMLVYYVMQRRNFRAQWGDMRRGLFMFLARYSIYGLAMTKPDAKSWRPHFLVLSGAPTSRWYLVELAHAISHGKGFVTVCSIIAGAEQEYNYERLTAMEDSIRDYCKKRNVPALVEVIQARTVLAGVQSVVKCYGIGPLTPNTVIFGETERQDNYETFAKRLITINNEGKNALIVREGDSDRGGHVFGGKKRIDVWWGQERQNAGLMLTFAHMLQNSEDWQGAKLNLISVVADESEVHKAQKKLERLWVSGRLDIQVQVLVEQGWQSRIAAIIKNYSQGAGIVFIGMRPPENESAAEYAAYYKGVLQTTNTLPLTAIVTAAHEITFSEIFQ